MSGGMATVLRVLRLAFGLWSPSRVAALSVGQGLAVGFGHKPPPLSWLDRWELQNAGCVDAASASPVEESE